MSPGRHELPPVILREVIVSDERDGETETLRLITSLPDLPAERIAQLYRYRWQVELFFRWQVELFFRWLKSVASFTHLIGHAREGLQTSLSVTLIGVMLMSLHTGCRPGKYLFALLGSGADLADILRERERQCEVAR